MIGRPQMVVFLWANDPQVGLLVLLAASFVVDNHWGSNKKVVFFSWPQFVRTSNQTLIVSFTSLVARVQQPEGTNKEEDLSNTHWCMSL